MRLREKTLLTAIFLLLVQSGTAQTCAGKPQPLGTKNGWALDGGGFAMFSKMNVNIDGYAKAYHPDNAAAGALLHLCEAGKVYLPDGTSYEGSESNQTCTGKFMTDFAKIRAAGWQDPSVGAINWYGIVGQGSATIHGRTITAVKPVEQKDGSGFYVSPTSLFDHNVKDEGDQDRYVNPLHIPAAVVPRALQSKGIVMGTFGAAIDKKNNTAVPFVVDDSGPAVGEGSVALARMVAGQPITDDVTRKNRYVGQVDTPTVLWVFFGGKVAVYDHMQPNSLIAGAQDAYKRWGGDARLKQCLAAVPSN